MFEGTTGVIRSTISVGQGPAGPPGPPGSGGGGSGSAISQSVLAAEAIGGHLAVFAGPSGVSRASSSVVSQALKILGITSGAVSSGGYADVISAGLITEPSWNWTPGSALFLGLNGALTQTAPTAGFILQMGVAISATSINLDIKQPIIL